MGWKRVAWAGCLAPVLGGCNIAYYTTHNLVTEALVDHTQHGINHELRKDAREAWQEVRCQYPRRMFTHEFRDGFIDGYTDYLDRGGDAQPPAVPPVKYTRHKRYFTPEGHALVKDYYLGFKYGVDVAVATGQRQFLTVPVLLPEKDTSPPAFNVVPGGAVPLPTEPVPAIPVIPPGATVVPTVPPGTPPAAAPLPTPRPLPAAPPSAPSIPGYSAPTWRNPGEPLRPGAPTPPAIDPTQPGGMKFGPLPMPKPLPGPGGASPTAPVPRAPLPPADPGGTKFDPIAPPVDPDQLPRPDPPLPIPGGSPTDVSIPVVPRPDFGVKLPEPPAEVPTLPEGLPTPPIWDDVPVIAPSHVAPPPLPTSLSMPPRK